MWDVGTIDFVGQHKAENIIQRIVSVFSLGGLGLGYWTQSLKLTFQVFFLGVVLSAVATIPPWAYLRRNPVTFAPDSLLPKDEGAQKDKKTKDPSSGEEKDGAAPGETEEEDREASPPSGAASGDGDEGDDAQAQGVHRRAGKGKAKGKVKDTGASDSE